MPKGARSISRAAAKAQSKSRSKPPSKSKSTRGNPSAAAIPIAARRHPLVAEVERQLRSCGVLRDHMEFDQSPLVLGVSGGTDSTALLLACIIIRDRKSSEHARLEPIVGHVHHHLREAADGDARFVEELCKQFGVAFHTLHVRPAKLKGNTLANARLLRYEALAQLAKQCDAEHVAVAHHGEDQLETMLIALCRGAGLDGMTGMAWTRPLWCGVSLVRPLLGVSKLDCRDLCRSAGIQWREDPSNVDPQRVRARLRRDVMSHLREIWPDVERRITSTSEAIGAAKTALDDLLARTFGECEQREWNRASLAALPAPVIAAGLRRCALDAAPLAGDELNQRHLIQAAEAIRSDRTRPLAFDWPRRLQLRITSKNVQLISR